jgi:elongation factor Ts
MAITAAQVNELRQKTGAGMMDCKKALTESNGDFEKAVDILRKKGAAVAAKRADKSANEGIVLTKLSEDNLTAAIVEVNCETDFVAKSDVFIAFANKVLDNVYFDKLKTTEALFENKEIQSDFDELVGKIGEKIVVSRLDYITNENGFIVDYIHPGSKLGVIIVFDDLSPDKQNDFATIAKDVAMQVAAMKPISVYRDEVPKDLIEKEIDIYKEIARKEGKPEQILEKIAQGKLAKYYQENCLSEQAYIKDNAKSIGDLISEFNKANSTKTRIKSFLRFHLGDEKK